MFFSRDTLPYVLGGVAGGSRISPTWQVGPRIAKKRLREFFDWGNHALVILKLQTKYKGKTRFGAILRKMKINFPKVTIKGKRDLMEIQKVKSKGKPKGKPKGKSKGKPNGKPKGKSNGKPNGESNGISKGKSKGKSNGNQSASRQGSKRSNSASRQGSKRSNAFKSYVFFRKRLQY